MSEDRPLPEEELLDRQHELERLARELVPDTDARDAVQDAWVEALTHDLQHVRSLPAWLRVVTRRKALRGVRRNRQRRERERLVAGSDRLSSHVESLERESVLRFLRRHVERLGEPYSTVLKKRYFDGLELDEIACELDRPQVTVRSQLKRGLDRIRTNLNGRLDPEERTKWLSVFALWPRRSDGGAVPGSFRAAFLVGVAGAGALVLGLVLPGAVATQATAATPEGGTAVAAVREHASRLASVRLLDASRARVVGSLASPIEAAGSLLVRSRGATDHRPVAELHLVLEPASRIGGEVWAVTHADGTALVEDLAPGRWTLRPQRGDPVDVEIREGATTSVELATAAGVTLQGRVVGADGLPQAGAELWVSWPDRPEEAVFLARADASGFYVLAGVDPRSWVEARLQGHASSSRHPADGLAGLGSVELEVGDRTGVLTVIVVDHRGRPVPDALVRVAPTARPGAHVGARMILQLAASETVGRTDLDGVFETRKEMIPDALVAVVPRDGPPWAAPSSAGWSRDETLRIELPPPSVLTGTISNLDGSPAVDARVLVELPTVRHSVETTTDTSGSFRLDDLPPAPYELRASFPRGSDPASLVHVGEIDSESEHVELVLSMAASLTGIARDSAGVPLAGWRLTLELEPEERHFLDSLAYGSRVRFTDTDEAGRFRFRGLTDVAHAVRLYRPEGVRNAPLAFVDGVRPGRELEVAPWAQADTRPASVRGRVSAATGAAPRQLYVHCAGFERPLRLDPGRDGAFESGPLPAGAYEVHAWGPDLGFWLVDTLDLAPGEERDVGEVHSPVPGRLRIHVSPGEVPTGLVDVHLTSSSTILRSLEPGLSAGRTLELSAPPGSYEMLLRTETHADVFRTVEVAQESTAEVFVELEPARRVEVSVFTTLPFAGRPLIDLELHGPPGTRVVRATTRGRPTLETPLLLPLHLGAGDYLLTARMGSELSGVLPFTIANASGMAHDSSDLLLELR